MARDTWYRLDNIGKFYSAQAGSSTQTVFRYSATLVDEVDESILQHALEKTVEAFPEFNVHLRSGMFWHYLEQATQVPDVTRENLPICFGVHVDTKSILYRVSYYRSRINFEVSHIVSDGRGSLNFFKVLVSLYLQERYAIEDVAFDYDGSDYQKSEDSFNKYFERDKAASESASKIYRLSGWKDAADPTYMEYHLPLQSVLELARSYKVSVTSLVIAAVICSVRTEMPHRYRKRAIRVSVPVDLRQIFGSTTTKNFFGLASVSYTPEGDESVEEIASLIQAQLKTATTAESLKPRMNRMIAFEKSILLRLAPLFIKDFGLEWASRIAERETTTTVSNLGKIDFDEKLTPYIRNLNVLTSPAGLNFTLMSFKNDLSIGISTIYSNLDIIKNFCRFFSSHEIKGYLNISKTSEEVAIDQREVKLEASVKRISGQSPEHDDSSTIPQAPLSREGDEHETM